MVFWLDLLIKMLTRFQSVLFLSTRLRFGSAVQLYIYIYIYIYINAQIILEMGVCVGVCNASKFDISFLGCSDEMRKIN